MNARFDESGLQLPPHSIEAEQAIIGGFLLVGSEAWERVASVVSEADFYRDDHRRIFGHIRRMCETAKAVDIITLYESIEASNQVEQTGGLAYLGEIANAVPSAANIAHYARIVADHALRRRLILAAGQIDALARQPGRASDAVAESHNVLMPLADIGGSDEPKPIGEVLSRAIDEIQRRFDHGSTVFGLRTGFEDLDKKIGGLQAGDLVVLAGRPSMGKSALGLNIAENVAVIERKPVVVFSVEMSDVQLAMRSIASLGNVPSDQVRSGQVNDEGWDGITVALGKLHEAPLFIDESAALSAGQMLARCRRIARKHGDLALVVIDYLQLMRGEGNSRNEELGDITRRLKLMAKELGCPVIALSQLSRKVEERTNRRPLMSDLRESGAIEQDADVILMMYRDEYYNQNTEFKGLAECIIAKNRMGETGMVPLVFQGQFSRFRDADKESFAAAHQRADAAHAAPRKRRAFE